MNDKTVDERQVAVEEYLAKLKSDDNQTHFDLGEQTAPKHNWVDRGLVLSCEGAGHPNHRHFKYPR